MKVSVVSWAVLFTSIVFGCDKKTEGTANAIPPQLLIAIYGGDNPTQFRTAIEPLRLHLEKKLGTDVKFFFTTDYAAVIQALRAKKVHMAELTPFAYIIASQKPGLLPIATMGRNGKPALYKSFIFTNPKTGIKNLDDLKAKSKMMTLCYTDPASTSGHLIPRAYLTSIGLDPSTSFKETMFAGNHASAILSVKAGKVDVGCSSSDLAFDKLVREGIIRREDIVVLWESPGIINNSITVRDDLDPAVIKKVQNIYLNMAKENYAAFSSYAKLYYPDPSGMTYLPAQDSMYNSLRKVAGDIKDLNLLDKK
jgi:phosphonate transport system substrate-binding protein